MHFVAVAGASFLPPEGHYTRVYTAAGQRFCACSTAEAQKRLAPAHFLRAHRSYLVNPGRVASFERQKDTGICRFDVPALPPVPVSRSRLKAVRDALGL